MEQPHFSPFHLDRNCLAILVTEVARVLAALGSKRPECLLLWAALLISKACCWLYMAKKAIVVQLSGMVQDRAEGVNLTSLPGGLYKVMRSETALVGSMPNVALCLHPSHCILSQHRVAIFINDLQPNKWQFLSQMESE